MKELDILKEKCVQAMKDVDAFVDEHYEELIAEMKSQHNLPYYWKARIVSNCGEFTDALGSPRKTNGQALFTTMASG